MWECLEAAGARRERDLDVLEAAVERQEAVWACLKVVGESQGSESELDGLEAADGHQG